MRARIIASLIIGAGLLGSLAVFETVSKTDAAIALARAAVRAPDLREDYLERAENSVLQSWSGGVHWHSGAAEAASWSGSLRAIDNVEGAGARAAEAGERAVALSPVQPVTWMRLSALADSGFPVSACDAAACLERSWRAAIVIEPEPGCTRIQMSVTHGLMADDSDPRFGDYVQTLRDKRNAVACFGGLPQARAFRQLLRLREGQVR